MAVNAAHYILQERVNFAPVIETPFGPTKAEVRVMYIWLDELQAVTTIVRMGRGKMMGVDHNRDMEWVGASAGFFPSATDHAVRDAASPSGFWPLRLSLSGSADTFARAHRLTGIGVARSEMSPELLNERTRLMIESQTFFFLRDPTAVTGAERIESQLSQHLRRGVAPQRPARVA